MRACRLLAIAGLVLLPARALASGPEELEQLEPENGETQLEYYALVGSDGEDEHEVQALHGFSDNIALGVEIEGVSNGDGFEVEGVAPTALIVFSDAEAKPFGFGLELQAEFEGEIALGALQARVIAERRTPGWWAQANLMLRHQREDGASATGIAYAWGLSRAIREGIWLGLESSGQAARLTGSSALFADGNHFLGPSLTFEPRLGAGRQVELGLAWSHRIAGEGPRNSARLFVQFDI
jgi:hypothetical protein